MLAERLANGGSGLRGLLRQRLHALLHFLAETVEVARRLLCCLVHAARSVVELAAHLLELPADLGDDSLEARLELADSALGVGLRLFAQAFDLRQRLLSLARRVARKSRPDLLRSRFGMAHGVLHHAGIRAHHVVQVLRLGIDRVQQGDDRLMPAFQDRVDLGVRRIQRLGGGENSLALTLETLGEPVDLAEQPARDLAQGLRLAGEDAHRFFRLRADLIGRLLHQGGIVGEHLIELRRLLPESFRRRPGMLAQHPVGLGAALSEGELDRLEAFGKRDDDGLRAFGHRLVEAPGLLTDRGLQRLHALEQ